MVYVIAIWVTMMASSGLDNKFGYIGSPIAGDISVCEQFRSDFPPVQKTVARVASGEGVESVTTKCVTVDEYNEIGKKFFK